MEYEIKVTYMQPIGDAEFQEKFTCGGFEGEAEAWAFAELCALHINGFAKAEVYGNGTITNEKNV